MGFRVGARVGPFSASTSFGGGSNSGGDDELGFVAQTAFETFFWYIVFATPFIVVSKLDHGKIILWWVLLHALSFIAIFCAHFAIINFFSNLLLPNKVKSSSKALFSLIGPTIYIFCLHMVPLAVRKCNRWFDAEVIDGYTYPGICEGGKKIVITASLNPWLYALALPLLFPEFLVFSWYLMPEERKKRKTRKAEQTAQLKLDEAQLKARKAGQAAQLVAQREKVEERIKLHEVQLEARKKLTEKRIKLHEALARLEIITDQVFSQSQLPGSGHLHPGPSTQNPLEQSLRIALADVNRCLTECIDVSVQCGLGQIPNDILNHEKGFRNLCAELTATFGYQDL